MVDLTYLKPSVTITISNRLDIVIHMVKRVPVLVNEHFYTYIATMTVQIHYNPPNHTTFHSKKKIKSALWVSLLTSLCLHNMI